MIKAVGPKGHFLSQPHTREYMHRLEFSELLTQPKEGGGFRNAIDVAREKTAWILENHFPEPLSEKQQSELNRILQSADSEFI